MKVLAAAALFLTVATIPIVGGVLFAFFLFGLFLLALVGVLAGLDDRTVRQRNRAMNPKAWRDGS
jgi:hypothetical protein